MHYTKVILAVAPLTAFAVQLNLPSSDIPSACRDTCQAIMDVANSCANSQLSDDVENQCVCGEQSRQSASDCYGCMHSNNGHTSNIDQIINVCHIDGAASGGGNGHSTTHEPLVASTTTVVAPPADSDATSTGGHTSTTSAGGHTNTPTSPPAVVTGAAAVGTVANGGLVGLVAMAAAGAVGMGL
ncbi:hypothetical protein A0O28_0106710 [Trichoderma guizhouense]|uniref:HFB protein n=1 Tax=Trichoderma guizhouense TaxID=1491466 RepID=A0A1T3CQV4_9HYPO|nr:hypothetical protein A0O28_0106710 [Trichoderma guizhouense]